MIKNKIIIYFLLINTMLVVTNKSLAIDLKPGEELADKQEFRMVSFNIDSLDPNLVYDKASNEVIKNMFEPLIGYSQKEGKYVPLSAESYNVSKDGKVWTFKLRKEIIWSDGKPVTAHDYVFSWKKIVDPKTASGIADYLNSNLYILNAKEIIKGELPPSSLGVRAIDDYTFEVTTTVKVPWFDIAIAISSLSAIPEHAVKKYNNDWIKPENLIVNGPFILDHYYPDDEIVLIKNKNYYDANNVVINRIQFQIIEDSVSAYLRYLSGDLDIVNIPKELLPKVEKNNQNINITNVQDSSGFAFNLSRDKFKDQRVRKAIRLAIDSKHITDNVIRLGFKSIYNWVPKSIEEARKLITEAGYTKNNPLTFEMLYGRHPYNKAIFVSLQQIFKKTFDGAVETNLNSVE